MLREKIYIIRKDRGYSQAYLATKLQISQRTYSKMERGETKLDWKRINEIATILEVDLVELVKDDGVISLKKKISNGKSRIAIEPYKLLLSEKDKRIEILEDQVTLLKTLMNL